MTTTKPRPLRPLLIAAIICLPVLYALSYGPVVWIASKGPFANWFDDALDVYLAPLQWSYWHGPEWWQSFLDRYVSYWI